MRFIFTQTWTDDRILYPLTEPNARIFLTPGVVSNLWMPHTFIANSLGTMSVSEASLVTYEVNRKKQITVHYRMSLRLSCNFDLSFFPHDTQVCDVIIESREFNETQLFSFFLICVSLETNTKAAVNYTWQDFSLVHKESARFQMEHLKTEYCENTRGSEFSCLRASFAMHRRLGYYAIRVYGPSIIVVVMTFVGFWMPIQGLPARVRVNTSLRLFFLDFTTSGLMFITCPWNFLRRLDGDSCATTACTRYSTGSDQQ